MMKNDHFFRFNVGLMHSDPVLGLMEKQGIKGVGIFVALMVELRIREEYRMRRASLSALARRWECPVEDLLAVVDDYGLFAPCSDAAGEACFSSPYLDEVMAAVQGQQDSQSVRGRRRAVTAERAADGRFTRGIQPAKQSIADQSKAATESAAAVDLTVDDSFPGESGSQALQPFRGWEAYVDEAFGEQSWMELQAMHSKLGLRLMEQSDFVVALFKQHIRTYGKEASILSLGEAKTYFSNFIRFGSPTRRRLEQLLDRQAAVAAEQDAYRFEQRDPTTGERSYCGMPIPKTAPPRPDANSIWDECLWQWG